MLQSEKRSHRTKAELRQRENAEQALVTGKTLREQAAVKENEIAHKEFQRVNRLLAAIEKNDALYEAIINRYCMLQAECAELREIKAEFRESRDELRQEYESGKITDTVPGGLTASGYYKLLSTMQNNILVVDRQIQAKQKMMLDIEKECAMTISAAARSIPKKPDTGKNPILAALEAEE